VVKFDVATGAQAKAKTECAVLPNVFGASLVKEAEKDDKIIGITAAMPSAPGSTFRQSFPKRSFDVGIANSTR